MVRIEAGHQAAEAHPGPEGGDVHEDEDECDVATRALQGVSDVALIGVSSGVGPAGPGEIHAHRRVVDDRQPQPEHLDEEESRKIVDEVHFMLERRDATDLGGIPPHDRRVRREVGEEEESDRNDARDRMEPSEDQIMTIDEAFRT